MKKVLKIVAGLPLLLLAVTLSVQAEEVTVRASLDRNPISLEDQAILTISVSGADIAPTLPSLPDLDVASSGRSTRVSIVNGAMSSRTDYSFALQPRKTGDFTIGPVMVQYKGKAYQSSPLTLHVAKSSGKEGGGKDLFIIAEVDRTSPYVGEQVLFRLKFYRRVNVANASLSELTFDGFQTADAGKETTYTANLDGVGYQVTELRRLLTPNRAGRLTIPGATLTCQVAAEGRQRTPGHLFGEDLFGFGLQRTVTKTLRSQPLALTVRSLPQEGKPSAFSGMVGAFHLFAEFDKKNVKKGESVTLTMKVSGRGDLSGAPRPVVQGIEQFKAYDDQPVISRKTEGDRIVSEKTFKTALVPLYAGDLKPLEVSFWYFDPGSGKYQKASATAPGLRVLPSDNGEDNRVVQGQEPAASKQSVQLLGKDILPITTDIYPLKDETFRPGAPLMLVLLLTPPLVFLGIFVFKKKRDTFASDIGYRRSTRAMKQARKGLEDAAKRAQAADPKECYSLLSRTFKGYVGDKLNVSGEAMTPGEIQEALQARMGQGPLVERTAALLRELEMRQFTPGGAGEPEGAAQFAEEARELIQQLEKKL